MRKDSKGSWAASPAPDWLAFELTFKRAVRAADIREHTDL